MSGFAVECFHEISQVLAKPLFFLVNVELLNVIYHFLLQTSEIDIHLSEFGEIVLNPGTNLADAFIFITRHLCQQVLYLSYALGEELFEFPALFASVFHQGVGSSVGRFNERGAFVLLVFGFGASAFMMSGSLIRSGIQSAGCDTPIASAISSRLFL